MFIAILRSAAANGRRLLYIWLAVLVANQIFIFGACFAPYCLAAAVPHTLAIAILVNFFGFRNDTADKKKLRVSSNLEHPMKSGLAADSREWDGPATNKRRFGSVVLCVLITSCVVLALVIRGGSGSLDTPAAEGGEAVKPVVYAPLKGEVPDERAPLVDRQGYAEVSGEIPDEHASLAQRREFGSSDMDSSYASVRNYDVDDEFDINDIEQYERLTKKKYRGTTDRTKHVVIIDDEAQSAKHPQDAPAPATKPATGADASIGQLTAARQPYRCVNSSGRVGDGSGRMSHDGEYSPFLGRSMHAGEFVIFQYANSAKEYWFKSSNCQRL